MRGAGGARGRWWKLAEPHLEVDFRHRIGSLQMDVAFRTGAPWTVLFGASGSGKSTILRVVAGLERADEGRLAVRGEVIADSGNGICAPAHERPVRWAGQRAYLFPWMTVESSLAFGLQADASGLLARGWIDEVGRALEAFHLTELKEKQSAELSGGEAQRVAVARAAIGASGRLLLLDEPFSGLDVAVRDRLIEDLRGWLDGSPVASVTHDVGEAFLLGAEVVRIADGRVVAQGPAEVVLAEERRKLLGVLA